jgi:predicted ester cyclase
MHGDEMMSVFRAHRDAESRRDYDGIMKTFTPDCYLATAALGTRSDGQTAARAAYVGYFTAFPDLAPEDEGFATGDDVLVSWGTLRGTSKGPWLDVPPGGGSFAVPFTNVSAFKDDLMLGETIYFDLATLCEQADVSLERIRTAAAARRATTI